MPCYKDGEVVGVPGKWIEMGNQGPPPNATLQNINAATKSASMAADAAGDGHCSKGDSRCAENKECGALPHPRAHHIFDFEEMAWKNKYYIRALCSMTYRCECREVPEPDEVKTESVQEKKVKKDKKGKKGKKGKDK